MKKMLFLILLIGVGFGIVFLIRENIGDLRPSIIPSTESLPEKILTSQKVGSNPEAPLQIPEGFRIGVFATNLPGVRDLQFAPRGTLLASLPKEGRVVALPDKNNDGIADEAIDIVARLNKPHGIAFYDSKLFVAEENRVTRYRFDETNLTALPEEKLFDLPRGGRHTTRSIVFDKKGNMYVSLGSTCDTCIEREEFIGTVIISDSQGKKPQVFSRGLRNAVFLTLHPSTDQVWVTEMGRDFLGDDLPPDEVNILKENADFGWPFCYGDKVWDKSFGQRDQAFCNNTISPFYQIPAHSAPLGLTFIDSPQMSEWQGDLLVAYHGSWNRSTPAGYKIVRITTGNDPQEHDFITGFLQGGQALGRPVDLIFDPNGSLYISDDKAGAVYKMVRE